MDSNIVMLGNARQNKLNERLVRILLKKIIYTEGGN